MFCKSKKSSNYRRKTKKYVYTSHSAHTAGHYLYNIYSLRRQTVQWNLKKNRKIHKIPRNNTGPLHISPTPCYPAARAKNARCLPTRNEGNKKRKMPIFWQPLPMTPLRAILGAPWSYPKKLETIALPVPELWANIHTYIYSDMHTNRIIILDSDHQTRMLDLRYMARENYKCIWWAARIVSAFLVSAAETFVCQTGVRVVNLYEFT